MHLVNCRRPKCEEGTGETDEATARETRRADKPPGCCLAGRPPRWWPQHGRCGSRADRGRAGRGGGELLAELRWLLPAILPISQHDRVARKAGQWNFGNWQICIARGLTISTDSKTTSGPLDLTPDTAIKKGKLSTKHCDRKHFFPPGQPSLIPAFSTSALFSHKEWGQQPSPSPPGAVHCRSGAQSLQAAARCSTRGSGGHGGGAGPC